MFYVPATPVIAALRQKKKKQFHPLHDLLPANVLPRTSYGRSCATVSALKSIRCSDQKISGGRSATENEFGRCEK